jgi:acetyl-CoA carboxylase carboxyltransferase component
MCCTAPHAAACCAWPRPGRLRGAGPVLLVLEPSTPSVAQAAGAAHDPDHIRADLQRVIDRHAFTLDANRPDAVAKRHARGGRTARENIADLCDDGSFIEYGALAVAAQTRRRSMPDLIANTPADGMVTGIGTVNGASSAPRRRAAWSWPTTTPCWPAPRARATTPRPTACWASRSSSKLPVVLFAEGGGGRPGDTDMPVVAGLTTTPSPLRRAVGPGAGGGHRGRRCFAGNAALLGCCDVIIATRASNIGMGGPAMIEGGGLGVFKPEEIGPSDVQHANGVIDVLVEDEAEAVVAGQAVPVVLPGPVADWVAPDQRAAAPRHGAREPPARVRHARRHGTLADDRLLLELRAASAPASSPALARIEGRPGGPDRQQPAHLGGAIDADAADKAARFMQLCDATASRSSRCATRPASWSAPRSRRPRRCATCQPHVRHRRAPARAVVQRRAAQGLRPGRAGMAGGGFHAPVFTVSWPTGEFGGMGLEGAVRLGYRKELEAAARRPRARRAVPEAGRRAYANGEAITWRHAGDRRRDRPGTRAPGWRAGWPPAPGRQRPRRP